MTDCAPYLVIVDEETRVRAEFPIRRINWMNFSNELKEMLTFATQRTNATVIRVDRVCDGCKQLVNLVSIPMSLDIAYDAVSGKHPDMHGYVLERALKKHIAYRAQEHTHLVQGMLETSSDVASAYKEPATQRLIHMAFGVFRHQPDKERN